MQPKNWSVNALSVELRVDRRTVAKRLAEAGTPPVEIRGRTKLYRLPDAIEAIVRPLKPAPSQRVFKPTPFSRDLLSSVRLCQNELIPWLHSDVVTLTEYENELGIDSPPRAEIFDWIAFGFPIIPPAEGEKAARVSRPHAAL